jgi:hypothetical protein
MHSPVEQLAEARRLLPDLPSGASRMGVRAVALLFLLVLVFAVAVRVFLGTLSAAPVPQAPVQTR